MCGCQRSELSLTLNSLLTSFNCPKWDPLRPINGPPNPTDPLTDPKLIPSPSPSNEPQMGPPTQHDGVRTTMKKGTPKMLSKSISRMPMGSMAGH